MISCNRQGARGKYGKIIGWRRPGVQAPTAPGASIRLSQTDKDRWDARYRSGAYEARRYPSALLAWWLERLKFTSAPGKAVDIACGAGRNSLYLARRGWRVDAIDISPVALERLRTVAEAEDLAINCVERDLEPTATTLEGFEGTRYGLAVMIRYTDTVLVKALTRAIAPGGYLIAEMHLQTREPVAGPRNKGFRVATGALRRAGAALHIIHSYEGLVTDPDGRTVALAQLVGQRPDTPTD